MIASKTSADFTQRVHLTAVGWAWLGVSIGLAMIGVYKTINLILLLAYFLGTLLMLNWWCVRRSLSQLGVQIDPLSDGFAGELRTVHCQLVNNGSYSVRGTTVSIQIAELRWTAYVHLLPARQAATLTRTVCPARRGVFDLGQAVLRNSYPFGLVEAAVTIGANRTFACYPRRGDVELARLMRSLPTANFQRGSNRTAVRQLTEGTDIHGLRPFRAGDSPRWIHWRTTARVGELMVREFDRAIGPSISLVLMPLKSAPVAEASLELAGTLISEWSRRQDGRLRLWLPLKGRWEVLELDHRRRTDVILRHLAAIDPFDLQCDGPPECAVQLHNRSGFVYITQGSFGQDRLASPPHAVFLDPTVASEIYRPPVAS